MERDGGLTILAWWSLKKGFFYISSLKSNFHRPESFFTFFHVYFLFAHSSYLE